MKCFNHEERDAVGTCKSCGKGVCRDCAVDLSKGLACRGRCEEDVARLIALIDQNVRHSAVAHNIMGGARKNLFAQALFFVALGLVFAGLALAEGKLMEFPGLFALLFLIYGGYTLARCLRLPKE